VRLTSKSIILRNHGEEPVSDLTVKLKTDSGVDVSPRLMRLETLAPGEKLVRKISIGDVDRRTTMTAEVEYLFHGGRKTGTATLSVSPSFVKASRVEVGGGVGLSLEKDEARYLVLFNKSGGGVSSNGVSLTGEACVVTRGTDGSFKGFALIKGRRLALDGRTLFSSSADAFVSIACGGGMSEGVVQSRQANTVGIGFPVRPRTLLLDGKSAGFTYDAGEKLVVFPLSPGRHKVRLERP
jgi:hypothetical protein